VQTCITSPPFLGLRDYNTGSWEGGNPECAHRLDDTPTKRGISGSTLEEEKNIRLRNFRDTRVIADGAAPAELISRLALRKRMANMLHE
jgi:hypothetical protein